MELKRERRYVVLLTESLCLNGTREKTLLWITILCKDDKLSITSLTSSTHNYTEGGATSDMCFFFGTVIWTSIRYSCLEEDTLVELT